MLGQPKITQFDDVPGYLETEAQDLLTRALSRTERSPSPRFIHLCGIPGSGKTTYAERWVKDFPGFGLVQFDQVMESLSGYQHDKAVHGLEHAFRHWELPARAIGYHLLQALLEGRRNVLFDHSAALHSHLGLIDKAREWGYAIEMHYLSCSPDLAAERVANREKVIQRHTPQQVIWDRHLLILELIPLYRDKVDVFLEISQAGS